MSFSPFFLSEHTSRGTEQKPDVNALDGKGYKISDSVDKNAKCSLRSDKCHIKLKARRTLPNVSLLI